MNEIVWFLEGVIRYAGNAGDDYLANKTREVLARAHGLQLEIVKLREENKRLRGSLAVIRETTGQTSVFHEADNALAGQGGER